MYKQGSHDSIIHVSQFRYVLGSQHDVRVKSILFKTKLQLNHVTRK